LQVAIGDIEKIREGVLRKLKVELLWLLDIMGPDLML
jgi:hypothetical protein